MGLAAFALSAAGCYSAINLLVVNCVTILHPVAITVEVVDAAASRPIASAEVSWAHVRGPLERVGATDPRGVFVIERSIQQMPTWMWPTLGTLDLRGWVLQVDAPGYAPWTADLGPLFRPPLSHAVGTVHVRLQRP